MYKRVWLHVPAIVIGVVAVGGAWVEELHGAGPLPLAGSGPVSAETQPSVGSRKAEELIKRAKDHLLEAMKALSEAGQLIYQERVPGVGEQLFSAMEHAQEMLQELQERFMSLPRAPRENEPDEEDGAATPSEEELRAI
jgi:hypothetical protein